MLADLITFLRVFLKSYPELFPKVQTALDQWGALHNIPTDHIIESVRPDKFSQIDGEIDGLIASSGLPPK